jgi:hypothetical protein
VPEMMIDVVFATANIVLLVVATLVLVGIYLQLKRLSRSTKQLQDVADEMARIDRKSVSQIARIAKEISIDIGKLRDMDASDDEPQFQSLH